MSGLWDAIRQWRGIRLCRLSQLLLYLAVGYPIAEDEELALRDKAGHGKRLSASRYSPISTPIANRSLSSN